jgi:hypothetical protein
VGTDKYEKRIERLRMALRDIASWRAGAHEHDDDMGHDRRDFVGSDDWEQVEEAADSALRRDDDLRDPYPPENEPT